MNPIFQHGILQGKNRYDMNQNFEDTEKGIKVAVYAGGQAAISLGTCILFMKKLCTPYLKCLTYTATKIHTNYIVFLFHIIRKT